MRLSLLSCLLLSVGSVACGDRSEPREAQSGTGEIAAPLTAGEERAHVVLSGEARALIRSGPQVPVSLPPGITIYPGAKIITNTVVERDGKRHVLLVFDAADDPRQIADFYKDEAKSAGASISFHVSGEKQISIGGLLRGGEAFAVSARRQANGSRVELSFD